MPKAFWDAPDNYLRRNHRIALRREIVHEMLGSLSGLSITDLGSGNGGVSAQFASRNSVVLVDQSSEMLAKANVPHVQTIVADLRDYTGEPADLVLAIGILAHIPDVRAVFESVARNTKSGGIAIVQFSDANRPINRLADILLRLRGRSTYRICRNDALALANRHQLVLVTERSHLLVLPGMPRILGWLLKPYDRFVRRVPKLAGWSSDTLCLFQKGPPGANA